MEPLIYLSAADVRRLMNTEKALPLVEEAFRSSAVGEAVMPPKVYLNPPGVDGDFRAMPAYVQSSRACGVKWVNVHPHNPERGLPSVMALLILSDAETGAPLAVMDATTITNMRTGAAGGVAVKYLARGDARVLAFVGCGAQAVTQWEAIRPVRGIAEARVWGHEPGLAEMFISRIDTGGAAFRSTSSIAACVADADIIVTTTPARRPIVMKDWLAPGVHINAIGADAAGKQELDPKILRAARVVIDDEAQAVHSGEINVPLHQGDLTMAQVHGTLGEVIVGRVKGRTSDEEWTVFDSTGLAIQDMVVARSVYDQALEQGLGIRLEDPPASVL